jgi:hypothetical protein
MLLQTAGEEIDRDFKNIPAARVRALALRHVVERASRSFRWQRETALPARIVMGKLRLAGIVIAPPGVEIITRQIATNGYRRLESSTFGGNRSNRSLYSGTRRREPSIFGKL